MFQPLGESAVHTKINVRNGTGEEAPLGEAGPRGALRVALNLPSGAGQRGVLRAPPNQLDEEGQRGVLRAPLNQLDEAGQQAE